MPSGVEVGTGNLGGSGGAITTATGAATTGTGVVPLSKPGTEKDATGRLRSRKEDLISTTLAFLLDFGVVVLVATGVFTWVIWGAATAACLGFAKGSECSTVLLRFFFFPSSLIGVLAGVAA